MSLNKALEPYIRTIEKSLEQKNWLSSMMGALTLIDICCSLSAKDGKSNGEMYEKWFYKYCEYFKITIYKNPPTRDKYQDITKWLEEPREYDEENKELTESDEENKEIDYEHVYFNGLHAYALRCSLLHNGSGDILKQRVYENAVRFDKKIDEQTGENYNIKTLGANKIMLDLSNESKAIEQIDNIINLNPRIFCEEIIEAVHVWINNNENDPTTLRNSKYTINIIN